MTTIALNEKNVKLIGRTESCGDILLCSLSGTGFEFSFLGSKLLITVTGGIAADTPENEGNFARFAVYIDGERTADIVMDEAVKSFGWESDGEASCIVRFIKLSECAMSAGLCVALSAEGEVKPTAEKPLKIEFIGDSITCGYGVDDPVAEHKFKTSTEDFTKAYAYKTANLLNADYSAFSISGYGIISGYTTEEEPLRTHLVPPYYKALGFSYVAFEDGRKPQEIPWDFSRYVPDLIVINLGTNDASYCKSIPDRCQWYERDYVAFLKEVRENNPTAKILCALGIMEDTLCDYVEGAAEKYSAETGDKEIYTLRFTPHDGSLGYAADWHPSEATHEIAAEKAAEKIREILGL